MDRETDSSLLSSAEDSREVDAYLLPSSFGQERLWLLDRLSPGGSVYNQPIAYRLSGHLNVSALERSLNEIVRRHEVLRTEFVVDEGVVIQRILAALEFQLPIVDVAGALDDDLQRQLDHEAGLPFDLSKAPLFRAKLFRRSPTEHVLVLTFHHIIFDGWSEGIVLSELQALYEAFRHDLDSPLPDLPIQYADYAAWLRDQISGDLAEEQRAYWKKTLAGLTAFDLPMDRPRPKVQTFPGKRRAISISESVTQNLKAVGLKHKATLFMVTAAAFQALILRYTSHEDIALGITVANRDRTETHGIIGFFANTLVLRTDLSGNPSFSELIGRVRDATLGAFANRDLPFEKLVEESGVERDLSRSPLFQILFNQAPVATDTQLGDLQLQHLPVDAGIAKFDLSVYFSESSGKLGGVIEYNTDLFDSATIDRLVGHYETLLEAVARNPEARLLDLPLLTPEEREQLLYRWNDTSSDYPRDRTVVDMFEEQARLRPEAIAVSADDGVLSYGQLQSRAHTLAAHLSKLGVRPGVLVGLHLERSTDMVVALLATMKAGGGYVPLDPAFPPERLAFMLDDSGATVLLTQSTLPALAATPSGLEVVLLDQLTLETSASPSTFQPPTPDDLAYVLYTSGSTGKPKGVEIPHSALTNFLYSMRHTPGCTQNDVFLAITTLSFDIAGLELYLPLICGGRVELVGRSVAADGRLLRERIDGTKPTMMQATPATWRMLIEAGWQGAPNMKALIGGEALPAELVRPLLERVQTLWNMYGPTETTIWSSVQEVKADDEITIGRPIANTTFFALDQNLNPVPIGVPGELFIGGEGLARGYHARPDLTAERFIANPFPNSPGARLYRTGDLVKYRADGRVVHLGRLDHQVKIRGFRIELGEIEAVLSKAAGVAQAVVVARPDHAGTSVLAAYVVASPGQRPTSEQLRQHVRQALPEYMVPQYFVALESLPLTPNGKIDRKKLPAPDPGSNPDATSLVEPRTPTERQVASVFAEILQAQAVGAHSNFFDLGGHSLLAIRLLSRLSTEFKTELPLHILFEAPTVSALSDRICELTGAERVQDLAREPGKARTVTERRLVAIWERVLGTSPIGTNVSFFDVTQSQDRLDVMLSEVRREFGHFAEGIPVSEFLETPTIEALGRILDAAFRPPSTLAVCLRPGGAKPPVFLIHAGGGYVFFYRALASRLALDRPVFGVRAAVKGDAVGPPFERSESVKALARRYIAEIRSVQPKGPYTLGGACFGGVVAFEMACQLQAEGEEIAGPLMLFDAFLDDSSAEPQQSDPSRVAIAGTVAVGPQDLQPGRLRTFADIMPRGLSNPTSLFGAVYRRVRQSWKFSDIRLGIHRHLATVLGQPDKLEKVQQLVAERYLRAALRMLKDYRPGTYTGKIVLFKSANGPDPEGPWHQKSTDGIDVYVMPGVHLEMMEEPVVVETSTLVTRYLE